MTTYSLTEKDLTDLFDRAFNLYHFLVPAVGTKQAEHNAIVAVMGDLEPARVGPYDSLVQELRQIAIDAESPQKICPRCGGDGTVRIAVGDMYGIGSCPWCGGTGWK